MRFPVIFRVLAVLNVLAALPMLFLSFMVLLRHPADNAKGAVILAAVMLACLLWMVVGAFGWFLASRSSWVLLLCSGLAVLGLAGWMAYSFLVVRPASTRELSILMPLTALVALYGGFQLMALRFGPVQDWVFHISHNRRSAWLGVGMLAISFVVAITASSEWHGYALVQRAATPTDTTAAVPEHALPAQEHNDDMQHEGDAYKAAAGLRKIIYPQLLACQQWESWGVMPKSEDAPALRLGGVPEKRMLLGGIAFANALAQDCELWNEPGKPERGKVSAAQMLQNAGAGVLTERSAEDDEFSPRRVNTDFVRWMRAGMLPKADELVLGTPAKEIYAKVFRRMARMLYLAKKDIAKVNTARDGNLVDEYTRACVGRDKQDVFAFCADRFANDYNATIEVAYAQYDDYGYFQAKHAQAFWLRRMWDGSANELYDGLLYILAEYDYDWLCSKQNDCVRG